MRSRALAVAAAAAALAGCGVGAGEGAREVRLTVTRDFGTRTLAARPAEEARGEETVMRHLQRRLDVDTRYGGGFVHAIEGAAGGQEGGRPVDWFYYVNGIQATRGAATTRVHAGDRIWWDRHDWGESQTIPAVVGSFPEPFRSGTEGDRLPVRVDCARAARAACAEVTGRLGAAGVAASRAALGTVTGNEVLRVVVGTWADVRRDRAAARIGRGPRAAGVYVRARGDALVSLDERGRPVRSLGAAEGLVAATRVEEQQPTWLVTGVGPAGVLAAARALREPLLARRFAARVEASGRVASLPEVR